MRGGRIIVLSHDVPGGVDSIHESGKRTRDIYRSELPVLQDKSCGRATLLLVEAHDLATVVDVPGKRVNGVGKVDQCKNTLPEQIAMGSICSETK